jgi:hypothetical protein
MFAVLSVWLLVVVVLCGTIEVRHGGVFVVETRPVEDVKCSAKSFCAAGARTYQGVVVAEGESGE